MAKLTGETRGNVFLRVAQIDRFREEGLLLAQNTIAAKVSNCISIIRRSRHDNPALRDDVEIVSAVERMRDGISSILQSASIEEVVGIEGSCAHTYFSVYGKLFSGKHTAFQFRSKRPPLNPVNATLSFLYTLYTNEYAAALEAVGLDSYMGFLHSLRSGRCSLACDLVEEARCHVERMVLTLFNLKILTDADFERQVSGAVWLNDEGRKKVIKRWQEKKRADMMHPHLKQKIQFGLLPYVQSNLLAKYVRGEIGEYPCYLNR